MARRSRHNRRRSHGFHAAGRALRFEPLEERRMLAVVTVDTLEDESDGDHSTGDFSLREAIALANFNPGEDTISFAPDLFAHGPRTLTLSFVGDQGDPLFFRNGRSAFLIGGDTRVVGPGSNLLTIDATQLDPTPDIADGRGIRIFAVSDGSIDTTVHVTLEGLALTGGDVGGDGGAIHAEERLTLRDIRAFDNAAVRIDGLFYSGDGGALRLLAGAATSEIADSIFEGNFAVGTFADGGGVFANVGSGEQLLVSRSVFRDNSATYDGGGAKLYAASSGRISVEQSLFEGNSGRGGGGLYAYVDGRGPTRTGPVAGVDIVDSLFLANEARSGGGGITLLRVAAAEASVTDTTVTGNFAGGAGGGIRLDHDDGGAAVLRNATITYNISGDGFAFAGGGGVIADELSTFENTIIAANTDLPASSGSGPVAADVGIGAFAGTPTVRYSLIGDNSGSPFSEAPVGSPDADGNLIGGPVGGVIDPLLGPLAYNGGPVFADGSRMLTHAPLPGSPAIDAGDPSAVAGMGDVPEFDQRGMPFVRVANGDDVPEARIDIGAIEWQPNPLPGDYNFNGIVDAADYSVWRDTLGSTTDLRADGSGNGVIDQDDYDMWKANFGNVLPPPGAGSGAETTALAAASSTDIANEPFSQPPALPGDGSALVHNVAILPNNPPAEPGADVRIGRPLRTTVAGSHVSADNGLLAWLASRRVDDVGAASATESPPTEETELPFGTESQMARGEEAVGVSFGAIDDAIAEWLGKAV